jgi:hypothetical protein
LEVTNQFSLHTLVFCVFLVSLTSIA